MNKSKITEIKETYTVKKRLRNGQTAPDGSQFEFQTLTRYKEVITVEGWPRFGHYLLDLLIYYAVLFIFGILLGIFLVLTGIGTDWLTTEGSAGALIDRLISWLIIYPGYFILFESTMQSTPGKLIMGRVVIDEYGEKPTFKQILGRSYARIVPFQAFSCLSQFGWHDTWSETMVIRKKDLQELKLAMKVEDFGNDAPLQ